MAENADLFALLAEMKKSMEKGQEEMKEELKKEMKKEEIKNLIRAEEEEMRAHVGSQVEELKEHVNRSIGKVEEDVQGVETGIDEIQKEFSVLEQRISDLEIKPNMIPASPELMYSILMIK
ncbi:hypothetical protein AVEN_90019-1 [Araneus ventricosus]|uniref:Uncharacterized protein n=1 Tax=Araneus ventricosus TaxID=182803 RepID=A0A4Y2DCD5_ARAVE|nr:hypothetical protein AVEN_90019-1 [Araneus ventricosus]